VQQVLESLDLQTFLDWAEAREERYELVNGQVVGPLTPVTRDHARVSARLCRLVESLLDLDRFEVTRGDLGVQTPAGIRVPDLMVEGAGGGGRERYSTSPLFLAEVLSETLVKIDMAEKSAEYARIPSLHAYLALSQDEPRAWLWLRSEQGWPDAPAMFDAGDVLEVPALGLRIPLAKIYAGPSRAMRVDR